MIIKNYNKSKKQLFAEHRYGYKSKLLLTILTLINLITPRKLLAELRINRSACPNGKIYSVLLDRCVTRRQHYETPHYIDLPIEHYIRDLK